MSCIFHTDAPPPVEGAGGTAPVADVVVAPSPFIGNYLTDAAGRTLYTYGNDFPGDCQTAPVSNCTADCLVSWPIFEAGARVLGAGLDDAAFGSVTRGDGLPQTTYYGWPLYYYKSDLSLGQLTGQGKAKTWHAAEVVLPEIVIMKVGTTKYLANTQGHTLYVSAADQAGTDGSDPVSTCADDCLDSFEPFHAKTLSVVTSLEASDFEVFVRKGKLGLQIAYKGLPLYLASSDVASGTMNGLEIPGFTAAVP
jgi:predicted lipoprotein with Yx(FWY)xxD motif